jgi:hypothetical protein
MSSESQMARDVTARQAAMFAMFVGPGLYTTRAALAAAAGIPESTLKSWANGAAMPLHGALALRRYLPREALNMLTEPGGVRWADITVVPNDWDGAAANAAALVADVCDARRDGKIDHVEDARLSRRAKQLIAELSEVAGDG